MNLEQKNKALFGALIAQLIVLYYGVLYFLYHGAVALFNVDIGAGMSMISLAFLMGYLSEKVRKIVRIESEALTSLSNKRKNKKVKIYE